MKKVTALLALVFVVYFAQAQPPKGPAKAGNVYGKKVNKKEAVDIKELPGMLAQSEKVPVKVKAKVVDVCPKKGCWMNLYVNDSTNVFVKMKDYAFFVPLDIKGKTVVLDGLAYVEETSVAELRHYAEDAKRPQEEIDAITQPKRSMRFTADGIIVVE